MESSRDTRLKIVAEVVDAERDRFVSLASRGVKEASESRGNDGGELKAPHARSVIHGHPNIRNGGGDDGKVVFARNDAIKIGERGMDLSVT